VDFDFSPEQQAFVKEVEQFIDENDDPEVFDLTRENMAQIVDTPPRRAFMAKMGERGWLGMTWPKEYGGSEGEGVYEYLLTRPWPVAAARRSAKAWGSSARRSWPTGTSG
jgi:alkylation response protein AidB-like acyl-CoA dehydrogenase